MLACPVRTITAFKTLAITAGIFVSLACGGILGAAKDITPRSFYVINAANGAGPISATITEPAPTTYPVQSSVPFGTISSEADIDVDDNDHSATVAAVAGAYTASTPSIRTQDMNLIIALNPAAGPVCLLYPMPYTTKPTLVFVKDGSFQGSAALDIYVTAPGAGIVTVAPDGTLTENGTALTLSDALHPNTDFQVRLTKAGTKDVVFDFGTSTGVASNNYRIYALYHNATAEQSIVDDFQPVL